MSLFWFPELQQTCCVVQSINVCHFHGGGWFVIFSNSVAMAENYGLLLVCKLRWAAF